MAFRHNTHNTHSRQHILYFGVLLLSVSLFILVGHALSNVYGTLDRAIAYVVSILYVIGVVLLILVLYGKLLTERRFALLIFLAGHLLWYAWPLYRALVGDVQWIGDRTYFLPVTDRDVIVALAFVGAFLILTLVAYLLFTTFFSRTVLDMGFLKSDEQRRTKLALIIVIIGCFGVGFVALAWVAGGIGELIHSAMWSRAKDQAWAHAVLEGHPLRQVGIVAMVSASTLALSVALQAKRLIGRGIFFILFIVGFSIVYIDTGTRTWTLMMIAPPVIVWLSKQPIKNLLLSKRAMVATVIAIITLVAMNYQVSQRYYGFESWRQHHSGESGVTTDDNNLFLETAIAVSAFPKYFEHVQQSTLILFITNPIPRAIWNDKPYPKVIREFAIARDGQDVYFTHGISRLPSVVGQYYISWGVLGVVMISVAYGGLLALTDAHWRRPHSKLFYLGLAAVTIWLLLSFRGLFPGFHYSVLFFGGAVYLVNRIGGERKLNPKYSRQSHVKIKC